jgi:hypothetical protein
MNMNTFIYFVKDKFIGLVQPFLIPNFIFISVKVIHYLNPLNTELNPICHLLASVAVHHILHVSRIRVKYIIRNSPLSFHLH